MRRFVDLSIYLEADVIGDPHVTRILTTSRTI